MSTKYEARRRGESVSVIKTVGGFAEGFAFSLKQAKQLSLLIVAAIRKPGNGVPSVSIQRDNGDFIWSGGKRDGLVFARALMAAAV